MKEHDLIAAFCSDISMRQRYEVMIPNCYTAYDNECDIWGLRKSGYCDEIEIKVSRSDFLNDARKTVRYRAAKPGEHLNITGIEPWKKPKYEALEEGLTKVNYFTYFTPEGLIKTSELPDFAGHVEILKNGYLSTKRVPKLLHKNKVSIEFKYKMVRKCAFRYLDTLKRSAA